MKVYTRVVIDMTTLETLEEESYEYEGPVELCVGGGAGGGSAGGTYVIPTEVVGATQTLLGIAGDWNPGGTSTLEGVEVPTDLSFGVVHAIQETGYEQNPYAIADDYDNAERIVQILDRLEEYEGLLRSLDYDGDWESLMDTVKDWYDTNVTADTSGIEDAVTTYEDLALARLQRQVGRWAAGMSDINAVNGSGFMVGLALLESEHARGIAAYTAQQMLERDKYRIEFLIRAGAQLADMLYKNVSLKERVVSAGADIGRVTMVAEREAYDRALDLDMREALWDIELYQTGANMIAAPIGGVVSSTGPSMNSSARMVGAGLSGAGMGAMAGFSIGNVPGAVIGGVAGAIGGALGAS